MIASENEVVTDKRKVLIETDHGIVENATIEIELARIGTERVGNAIEHARSREEIGTSGKGHARNVRGHARNVTDHARNVREHAKGAKSRARNHARIVTSGKDLARNAKELVSENVVEIQIKKRE